VLCPLGPPALLSIIIIITTGLLLLLLLLLLYVIIIFFTKAEAPQATAPLTCALPAGTPDHLQTGQKACSMSISLL
jgi:hypothetical protein